MRSRSRSNPFSLFSFQDIITGLCGIMIFMVLVQVVGFAFCSTENALSNSATTLLDEERKSLVEEITALNERLVEAKGRAAKAIVLSKDKARPEAVEKVQNALTEKERVVAALVSQVHDLETQVEAARNADAEDRARVREMERTRRLLEQQIAGMKGRRGVTLIPERGESKIPVYIICSSSGLEIHSPFEKKPKKVVSAIDMGQEFGQLLAELDHTTHCVVLLVRPSGVRVMNIAVEFLQGNCFSYGRDPIEESEEIVFDVKGER